MMAIVLIIAFILSVFGVLLTPLYEGALIIRYFSRTSSQILGIFSFFAIFFNLSFFTAKITYPTPRLKQYQSTRTAPCLTQC